jgi:hypothetical protein
MVLPKKPCDANVYVEVVPKPQIMFTSKLNTISSIIRREVPLISGGAVGSAVVLRAMAGQVKKRSIQDSI